MTINTYDVSQLVRIEAAFTDIDDAPADPDIVTLSVMSPSGVTTVYEYGGSPDVVTRTGVGAYYADVDAIEAGDWFYKWESTGAGEAVDEGQFAVAPSHF